MRVTVEVRMMGGVLLLPRDAACCCRVGSSDTAPSSASVSTFIALSGAMKLRVGTIRWDADVAISVFGGETSFLAGLALFPSEFNFFLLRCSRNSSGSRYFRKSRDTSVGIALGYGMYDRGSRVRFPAGAGNVSLQPASYPMGTKGPFHGGKAAGAWNWPLTSISCRGQRMSGAISPLPQYAFMAWCSVKRKSTDNFTFTRVLRDNRWSLPRCTLLCSTSSSCGSAIVWTLYRALNGLLPLAHAFQLLNRHHCFPYMWVAECSVKGAQHKTKQHS
jgi:hypothetical protein